MSIESDVEHAIGLYRERIQPFLREHGVSNFDALDRCAELLLATLQQKRILTIGFLGEAQVGKSSLINALLGKPVLPSGGIGPLTAQATRVEFGAENGFEVSYHSRQQLDKVRFAVDGYLRRSAQPAQARLSDEASSYEPGQAASDQTLINDDDLHSPGQPSRREQHYINQLKLMFLGADPSDSLEATPTLLLEALKATLGQAPLSLESDLSRFAARIEEIRSRLGQLERVTQASPTSTDEFDDQLWIRAADWLAPLGACRGNRNEGLPCRG